VTLLGDESNAWLANTFAINHELLSGYKDEMWNEIELSYRHDSYLGVEFEQFCFLRFAALNRMAQSRGLDRFIYLDSDIIILNRDFIDALTSSLVEKDLGCLTPEATFFSAWRRETLSEFVRFLPTYFSSPAGGDRHCDMYALSEYIKLHDPKRVESGLARTLAAYNSDFYFKDPNFSFSPILMKQTGIWDYFEVNKTHCDINSFIKYSNGAYVYKPYPDSPPMNIDFVHLNGGSKFYHEDFRRLIVEAENISVEFLPSDAS
jgi:hypothetical protein